MSEQELADRAFGLLAGLLRNSTGEILLVASSETLKVLGREITKQLGTGSSYDPAQLLYIEALRDQVQAARQEMIKTKAEDSGLAAKTRRHLAEEEQKRAKGREVSDSKGLGWFFEDDDLYRHSGLPGYAFLVEDNPRQVEQPKLEAKPKPTRPMSLSQFVLFAGAEFGTDEAEASRIYEADSDDVFTRRFANYLKFDLPQPQASQPKGVRTPPEEHAARRQRLQAWLEAGRESN